MNAEDLLIKYENLVYYHIHKMRLWHQFPDYREDMLQEGRMAVLRAYSRYQKEPNCVAYIHSTVRNAIYDFVFKDMKLHVYATNLSYIDGSNGKEDDEFTERDFLYEQIVKEPQSEMLIDYFFRGMTQADVAEQHKVSQQWVSTVVNKFRYKLRGTYFDTK